MLPGRSLPDQLPRRAPARRRSEAPSAAGLPLLGAALLAPALLPACAGPDPERPAGRRGTMDDVRALLEESAAEPIAWEDVDEPAGPGDAFDGAPPPDVLQARPDQEEGAPEIPPLLDPATVPGAEGEARAPEEGGSREGSSEREGPAQEGPGRQTPTGRGQGEAAGSPTPGDVPPSPFSDNPYLLFGPRIVVHEDGLITKVYPLPPGKGQKMVELMSVLAPFPMVGYLSPADVPADAPRDPGTVEVVLLPEWDQEPYQNLLQHPPPPPTQVKIADWMVVTAGEELLWEVESFVKLFAAGVPQIEIEAKIVEVTESDELDVGVRTLTEVGPDGSATQLPTVSTTGDVDANDTVVDSFTVSFPNKTDVAESLLALSTIQDGYAVNALIEAVKNWENVSIDSQPKIAVREGGTASIVNTTDIPFYGFQGITATGGFQATLQNKEVGTKLYVVPRVVADTVAMDINLEISQQVGTLVSFVTQEGGELATPLVARRQARTVVYLEPGQAVVLGGLSSRRVVEQESKVPVLGDIPLLGWLFRSTFQRTETTNVIFIIRPRILQAAELRNEF